VVDEYGVENLLWHIEDAKAVERAAGAMRDKRLLIADGHHRYETAREYRDECRKTSSDRNAPHEFVMMTLVNINSPGWCAADAPRGFRSRGFGEKMERGLQELGGKLMFTNGSDVALLARLEAMGREGPAFGVVTQAARAGAPASRKGSCLLGNVSELERKLDVVVLHELVLNRILGISAEAVREQRNVRYFRSAKMPCSKSRTARMRRFC